MALVRVERRQETAVLFLQRPPVNALDADLVEELHTQMGLLAAEPPPGGVVLTGEGRAFCAGVDFKQVPSYDGQRRARMIGRINASVTSLYGLPTATVAAVNGHAIGGGLVLALACDARLAADADARLGLTEVTAGIPYPACPMTVVESEIEPGERRRLVLSGELLDPAAAHARGLVDRLVAAEELLDAAIAWARELAGAASYARVKDQLRSEALSRMRAVVASGGDPLVSGWVEA